MKPIKRILVILDPTSNEQPALDRAAWLAGRCGGLLELFICDYDQYLADERIFDSASLASARDALIAGHLDALKEHARRIRQTVDVDILVDARWDHPLHEGISRKVSASKPDVVFKETDFHAPLRRSLFSNTDWNLIRCCQAPLWLVKPHPMPDCPRIVAAVDPLHKHDKPATLDHSIIAMATRVQKEVRGELHLMHAYEIAPAVAISTDSLMTPISVPLREVADTLRKQHSDAVFALADGHGLPHDRVHVYEGPTQNVLVRLTGVLQADLVTLGAVSRGGLRRLFLGSTAERVLDRLPCDLLIIKPAEGTHASGALLPAASANAASPD